MNNTFKPAFFLTLIFMFSSLPGHAKKFDWPWAKSNAEVASEQVPVTGINKKYAQGGLVSCANIIGEDLADYPMVQQKVRTRLTQFDQTLDQAETYRLLNEQYENKMAQDKLKMIIGAPLIVAAAVGITYWVMKNKYSKNMEMMDDVD